MSKKNNLLKFKGIRWVGLIALRPNIFSWKVEYRIKNNHDNT